jgi:ATP-binding cassette subfamily F protein uup
LLQEFAGTLFLVSHDRAFLENTVTQVIAFEGNSVLTEFGGGYDDWQRYTQQRAEDKKAHQNQAAKSSAKPNNTTQVKPTSKLSFKEQKELDAIPAEIEKLELEQAEINTQLANGELYKSQASLVKTLQSRITEIDSLLEKSLARWEALDAKK